MTRRTEAALAGVWRVACALVLSVAAMLPGCGGDGVDSGGTGMTTTLAIGPVSGYGSIVVGGVHYDETAAVISDEEGRALDGAALTLGAITRIEGSAVLANGDRLEATARRIQVVEQIVGPLETLDAAAGTLTVLGQRVAITPVTVLAPALGDLRVGDTVAVHGQLDVSGPRVVATRIERRAGGGDYVLRAAVDGYARLQRTLTLGGIAVSLAGLPESALPETLPAGTLARVRLRAAAAPPYVALALRRADPMLGDRDKVEIEGRVSALGSARQFRVDDIPVDATNASLPSSPLVVGARVEVEGRSVAGTIIASKVEFESEDGSDASKIELEGRISALDPQARTFVLRGLTVEYGTARFADGDSEAKLVPNPKVAVKGRLSADRTRVVATTIKIEN